MLDGSRLRNPLLAMKKLSEAQKARRERLRKKRWRSKLRRRGFGAQQANHSLGQDRSYLIKMPEAFNLSVQISESIACIAKIKSLGHNLTGRHTLLRLDFSETKTVSAAAMLILNAEIDRILTKQPFRIRVIPHNRDDWEDEITIQLDVLGFFDLILQEQKGKIPVKLDRDEFTVLPMMASNQLEPRRLQKISEGLERVANVFAQRAQLYEAMIEATMNAVSHAYPDDVEFKFSPIPGKAWWAVAIYSLSKREVRVVVFDQGVGIPATLHRSHLAEQLRERLDLAALTSPIFKDHARMIRAALDVSRTSKDVAEGRGQGLRDVLSPVDESKKGRVRILSGAGGIIYSPNKDVQLLSLPGHIGGTLIDWSLPVYADMEQPEK